ncbi:hypothetical protein BST97_11575 [Nonlabens spongiae]|uniref:RiboL-PSP-HEPN domain-containing protein n=1 Tax=Nonlabens spongiae TaxID=331648 RepID=A0A1W6MLU8_9FLAO|nr:MAE_28990/MAE_18760 family HEPN-like nuclease [Nonlabens spongiae]ARN78575.1 hypothetical protein BST97_11575 [Nonlabens spongiae]
MNTDLLWTEIETELSWRTSELRFLKNQISLLTEEKDRRILRRSAVLMLYSHFEGFFKFAFNLYIRSINDMNLECREVNSNILVSSLNDIFKALKNPNSKSRIFRKLLPDDSKLHSFARNVEFIEKLDECLNLKVTVSPNIIDTESNLKPKVLSKLLYSLGMDHNLFREENGQINQLLNIRNKIAHGESKAGLTKEVFETKYNLTVDLLERIKRKIMKSLIEKQFMKVA